MTTISKNDSTPNLDAKYLQQFDNIIPFVPNVLLMIITDYARVYNVVFARLFGVDISSDDKKVTFNETTFRNHVPGTTIHSKHPLFMTETKWSFYIDNQPNPNFSLSFGIGHFDDTSQYDRIVIKDNREICSWNCGNIISDKHINYGYFGGTSENYITGTLITFDADLERGTVSIQVNNKMHKDAITGISDLAIWKPYVYCRTNYLAITISIK